MGKLVDSGRLGKLRRYEALIGFMPLLVSGTSPSEGGQDPCCCPSTRRRNRTQSQGRHSGGLLPEIATQLQFHSVIRKKGGTAVPVYSTARHRGIPGILYRRTIRDGFPS